MEILLSNPDRRAIKWWVDTNVLNQDGKVFQIIPSEGVIEGGQNDIIQATFNPFAPEKYEKSVPLYIDDPELQ